MAHDTEQLPPADEGRLDRLVGRPGPARVGACGLTHWGEEVPPRQTWVSARYDVMGPDCIVQTCKHGCCVFDPLCGSMMLPSYWRLASEDEVRSVQARHETPNGLLNGGRRPSV